MSKRGEIVDGVRWDRTEQWECTVWVDKVAVWVGDAMNASDIAEGIRIGRRITTPAREEPAPTVRTCRATSYSVCQHHPVCPAPVSAPDCANCGHDRGWHGASCNPPGPCQAVPMFTYCRCSAYVPAARQARA